METAIDIALIIVLLAFTIAYSVHSIIRGRHLKRLAKEIEAESYFATKEGEQILLEFVANTNKIIQDLIANDQSAATNFDAIKIIVTTHNKMLREIQDVLVAKGLAREEISSETPDLRSMINDSFNSEN